MAKLTSTDIYGSLYVQGITALDSTLSAKQLTSTIANGTAPLIVASSTLVTNLNANLLDGQYGSYYTTAGNLTGTIPSAVLGNSTVYIGTTEVALNRASASLAITGVTNTNWDAAYNHSQITTGNPHGTTLTDLGVTSTASQLNYVDVSSSIQTQLNDKANDDEVVKLSGTQTIAGNKTFDGDTVITGDLTVSGTNFIAETTTVRTDDDLIELRSNGTTSIATPAGIAIRKYDGTNDGGIVIKNDGEVRVGKITLDATGKVSNSDAAQPVLTRAEKTALTNDDLLVWDSTNNRAVTKTLTALGIVNTTTLNTHTSNKENPHEVTAEQVDTYVKTTIDNKDANTLQEAKDYTYSQVEIDLKVSTINIKQDKLVAGENITIDPSTNVISSKIKEQNNNTDIKFWTGSQTEYDSLGTTDETTLYFIEEEE